MVSEELRRVALEARDGAGYFPALYCEATRAVERWPFTDPVGMREFTRVFASRYLSALDGGAEVPRCWRAAAWAARDGRLLIAQHLLLGVNAHVNYDLPQVVADLEPDAGDFLLVNTALAEAYAEVLGRLGLVSITAGALALGGFSLRVARDQAWRAGLALRGLGGAERAEYLRVLDYWVGGVAWEVARSRWWLQPLRRWEERDPRTVTRALLGEF